MREVGQSSCGESDKHTSTRHEFSPARHPFRTVPRKSTHLRKLCLYSLLLHESLTELRSPPASSKYIVTPSDGGGFRDLDG